MEVFRCPACRLVLWDPVTVSCGHSFCRRCLGDGLPANCQLCEEKLALLGSRTVSSNVLLSNLLEKCLGKDAKAARLKIDLQGLLRIRDYRGALRTLQKAITLAPDDLTLRVWRSEVYVALQHYTEALEDLEVLCSRESEECEGFFKKGKVFLEMGKPSEALLQFQHCLTLNPSFHAAQYELEKILTDDASPLPGTVVELKSDISENLKGSNSGKELTLLVSPKGEPLQDLKEICLGETLSDHSQAALPLLEWSKKRSSSDFSAKKEGDWEKGASADTIGTEPAEDYLLDLGGLLSTSDLECSLCIRMFFEPVTTPCGHTFCKECVERCLDHRPNCPLCKQSLREYLRAGKYNTTVLLEELMTAVFPSQLAERKLVHQAEMTELSNLTKNIPIFVCTMSFPGIVCPLHVFEPRYRLMMRRCQETGTKMFGMCMFENGKRYADDITLMAESEEELKSVLMRVKEERAKVGFKLNIKKTKIMASSPITSWQIDGEEMEKIQGASLMGYSLESASFADYGCVLEIQKIAFLPDGRSLVDTIGKRRFRVMSRGHRDGYNTADIEYLEDEK
ncbi:LON peptidase N-terminal domain and RING finger protein 1, partial [Varanus komodoensis]